MTIMFVVPRVDYQNGHYYIDYAVRDREGLSGIVTRSEKFDDYPSAYARLSTLQALARVGSRCVVGA